MSLSAHWEQIVVEDGSCLRVRQTDPAVELEQGTEDAGKRRSIPVVQTALLLSVAFCGAALLAAGLYALQVGRIKSANLHVLVPAGPGSSLRLADVKALRSPGFVSVAGTVANRTPQNLSNVEAVVELLDRNSQTVTQDAALIDTDRLPAGRSSAFRVEIKDNAQAVACRIHFRKLMGAALN